MTRRITPQTTLDNLKKEAKRWLKDLRANDLEARARIERALSKTPVNPVLRDVQLALAREYGLSGWAELKNTIEANTPVQLAIADAALVARFLEYACPDHHVRGRPSHRIARYAAMRILQSHPEIAKESLYTAIVCGEVEEVARHLQLNAQLVNQKSSPSPSARDAAGNADDIFKDLEPKSWVPLLYLCFTRLPLEKVSDNALTIARLLLDLGADPNVYFMAGDSRYTPLVGVIGEGEEDRPPHPQRDAITRLLLERGAEPYDTQVIYNIHFHGKILWYMQLMHEFSVKAGRQADWDDPNWHMLDMGGYGCGARWHLWVAIEQNDLELAEWCLTHGANPNAPPPRAQSLPQCSLYEQALRVGHAEIAELLVRYGAERHAIDLAGPQAFIAACVRLDQVEAKKLIDDHPEYLKSSEAFTMAARKDSADIASFLLDLGMPLEAEFDHKLRPLHLAASHDAIEVARLLIRRGAEVDPVESNWNNTPLDFAVYHEHPRMIGLLARYSSDVGCLAFIGHMARLREVLAAQPELAKLNRGSTPLFSLPEDEKKALETVELFLRHGADPSFRRADGLTAEDVARRRGLSAAADRLAQAFSRPEDNPPSTSVEVKKYELLAKDLVAAYAGDSQAMDRINQHYQRSLSLDDLRSLVWRVSYKVRQAGGSSHAFDLAEAQLLIANYRGFGNWTALIESVTKGTPPPTPFYAVDPKANKMRILRALSEKDWDTIIGVMKERRVSTIEGGGLMTDDVLKRIAEMDHVTSLSLGGSRQLSNEGMQVLARMPQIEHLELSEYPGGHLTDRGLEVLRHLPNLRTFNMTWQRGVTDVGI
jgi:ankyrin repeat protein